MAKINTVTDYGVLLDNDRGQRVLANMLLEGGFFKHNKTEGEQAVENFLKTVLAKTGHYPVDGYGDDMSRVVTMIAGLRKRRTVLDWVKNLLRIRKEF